MDIRSFFGSGGKKTAKKSAPPAALRGQSSGRAAGGAAPSSSSKAKSSRGGGSGKDKKATKSKSAASTNAPSSSKNSEAKDEDDHEGDGKPKASAAIKKKVANRLVIDDDDDDGDASTTEDETPVPTPSSAATTAAKKSAAAAVAESDDGSDDDGGIGDIVKVVTTPDRRRTASSNAAAATSDDSDDTDDDIGDSSNNSHGGSKTTRLKSPSTSKNDWEKALNYTPDSKKKKKNTKSGEKKRKTPDGSGSSGKPRKLEISAEDFFASSMSTSKVKSLETKEPDSSKAAAAVAKGAGGGDDDSDDLMGDSDDDVVHLDATSGGYRASAATSASGGSSEPKTKRAKKQIIRDEESSDEDDNNKKDGDGSDDDFVMYDNFKVKKEGAAEGSTPSDSSGDGDNKNKNKASAASKNNKRALEVEGSDDDEDFAPAKDDDDDDEDFQADTDDDEEDFMPPAKGKGKSKTKKSSPKKRKIKVEEDDEVKVENEEEEKVAKKTPPRKKTSAKSPKRATSAKKKSVKKEPKGPPPKPTESVDSYPSDNVTPELLAGYTFVFTGVLANLHRDEAIDYVKILGGRVTSNVSGKSNYLVCGDVLEDGRDVTEGSKYRKAKELGPEKVVLLHGEGDFYGLVKMLDDKARADAPKAEPDAAAGDAASATGADASVKVEEDAANAATVASQVTALDATVKTEAAPKPAAATVNPYSNPYAKAKPANPYAKPANPYAKPANPYAKPTGAAAANPYANKSNPYAKSSSGAGSASSASKAATPGDPGALWADKYAPKQSGEILGNGESVKRLKNWLAKWENVYNDPKSKGKASEKAALLSGPPGIGKTTTATLIARESGRDVLELNASDARGKKALKECLGDVTGSQVLSFAPPKKGKGQKGGKKRCIIMDEVDGMGAGDRSGMAELIAMIKKSKVPIICICNDRQSQKVRSLVNHCVDLKYRRPTKTVIARRAIQVARNEGMHVEPNAAEAIAESCGNDIRQVLNSLQMWSSKKDSSTNRSANMTYKDVKDRQNSINKDEILRVSMFDATKLIIEGPRGISDADEKTKKDSLYKRSDAFFSDYALMGLNVHENYLRVMQPQYGNTKAKNDVAAELALLERMYSATESMSDFGMAEHAVRGGDQNWALLPLASMLCVKVGHHAAGPTGGFLPGFPNFAGWLGKNSSRGKKTRLLHELGHHMNYHVSADTTELRLGYVPALRQKFLALMQSKEGSMDMEEVIANMDEYGLDRDDIFEKFDEFTLDKKAEKFSNIDSKTKAAFTREYNKGVHKSQALVEEQGVSKKKKGGGGGQKETEDPDAINEDGSGNADDDDDNDDELDEEAIKKAFKKANRGKKETKSKGKKKKK